MCNTSPLLAGAQVELGSFPSNVHYPGHRHPVLVRGTLPLLRDGLAQEGCLIWIDSLYNYIGRFDCLKNYRTTGSGSSNTGRQHCDTDRRVCLSSLFWCSLSRVDFNVVTILRPWRTWTNSWRMQTICSKVGGSIVTECHNNKSLQRHVLTMGHRLGQIPLLPHNLSLRLLGSSEVCSCCNVVSLYKTSMFRGLS